MFFLGASIKQELASYVTDDLFLEIENLQASRDKVLKSELKTLVLKT